LVLSIEIEGLETAAAQALIAALDAELTERYPEDGANHFRLEAGEVAAGRGVFLVARRGGVAVGCGAVRLLEGGDAEVKRMYTIPEVRGQGVGRAILVALEAKARDLSG
jgi:GNAT superfamily N-acetyltransferase